MDDLTLLAMLATNKALCKRIAPFIKEHSVAESSWEILKTIIAYYESFPTALCVDFSEFRSFLFLLTKKVKADKASLINKVLENVISKADALQADSSLTPPAKEVLAYYLEQDYATRIANISFKVSTGEKVENGLEAIKTLCGEFEREVGREVREEDVFVSTDLLEVSRAIFTPGLEWRLKELNVAIGPIRKGDFIIVGARPETGKTTFLAENVTHWSSQMSGLGLAGPIVWVNNEERSEKVMYRVVQSYFGITNEAMQKDLAGYCAKFNSEVGSRIRIISDTGGNNNIRSLDRLFDSINPSVIVFDQLDKVIGYGKEARDDLRLGKLYLWARNLAKEYGPVITASQVNGLGEGQKWITQEMLRGSTTDKAGEADVIITIGKENELTKPNDRFIHIAKNKTNGGPMTQEAYRHGYFEVKIKPEIARFEGSMK